MPEESSNRDSGDERRCLLAAVLRRWNENGKGAVGVSGLFLVGEEAGRGGREVI